MADDLPHADRRRGGKSPEAFRTISEVSDAIDVPQHVLRFWETKFTQIKPLKRGGGRRYYRPEDIDLLRTVRNLLYDEGYTIKGVQKILRSGGARKGAAGTLRGGSAADEGKQRPTRESRAQREADRKSAGSAGPAPAQRAGLSERQARALRDAIDELTELRDLLRRPPNGE